MPVLSKELRLHDRTYGYCGGQSIFVRFNCLIYLFFLQNHASAWPFMKAVEVSDAPDYYEYIKYPMGKNS